MTKKTSENKQKKIIEMTAAGSSNADIGKKLGINPTTVRNYLKKFGDEVAQSGYETACFNHNAPTMAEVFELAKDLKYHNATAGEALSALPVYKAFKECDVIEEQYADVIAICTDLYGKDLLQSALELKDLKDTTGRSFKQLAADGHKKSVRLTELETELKQVKQQVDKAKAKLKQLEQKQKTAEEKCKLTVAHFAAEEMVATINFESKMKELSLNFERLESVEALAELLNKQQLSDEQIADWLQKLELIDQAEWSLDVFSRILQKTKLLAGKDNGKALLSALETFGGLLAFNHEIQEEVKQLEEKAAGLAETAELKAQLDDEVAKAQAEIEYGKKASGSLIWVTNRVETLETRKDELEKELLEMEKAITSHQRKMEKLAQETSTMEAIAMDAQAKLAERDAIAAEMEHLKAKAAELTGSMDFAKSFMAMVHSQDKKDLALFCESLPGIVSDVNSGAYSLGAAKQQLIGEIAGDAYTEWHCSKCQASFWAEKKPKSMNKPYCPSCGFSVRVEVGKSSLDTLKAVQPHPHFGKDATSNQ